MSNALQSKFVVERFDKGKAEKAMWDTHFQECYDYILPRKADVTVIRTPGQKKGVNLLDSTAMDSNELLAGALHGLLTNPNGEWFELTTGEDELDQDEEVREYLQDCVRRMHKVLNDSNFQTEVHELYLDECCIGTAVMSMEEDEETIINFATRPIRECVLHEDRRGRITGVDREFEWDARQCEEEFGIDNLSPKMKKAFEAGNDDKFCIVHSTYKAQNFGQKNGKKMSHKWVDHYVAKDEKVDLRIKGFFEWPYATPRWSKVSGEKYGRSPGMKALPEAKVLNVMTKTTIEGAQKQVDPPLQMPDDGFVGQLKTFPGGINYYRAGSDDRVTAIFNDSRIDFGFQTIEMKQRKIRECFYVDQLKLQQGGPMMTATEVMQRVEEAMRLLGPMLGRFQNEFLKPLIDRLWGIMMRKGMFLEAPIQLSGRNVEPKYSSLIAKAQKMQEGQNIVRTIQASEPFITGDPTVIDNLDGDTALRRIAQIYGAPQWIFRKEKEVESIRKARSDAQAQANQMAQETHQADQVQKVASIGQPR